jgi:hypothetical protein
VDTWDRNGSTSGPNPWKIYDDDNIFSFTDNSLTSKFNLRTFSRRWLSQVNLTNQFILYLNCSVVSREPSFKQI